MAYQSFTIVGSGSFSKLNGTEDEPTPTHSGTVACESGDCWVRLLKTPNVTSSSVNNDLVPPSDTDGFTDGWSHLTAGASLSFGSERVAGATYSEAEPVGQIDIYIGDTASVTCIQH